MESLMIGENFDADRRARPMTQVSSQHFIGLLKCSQRIFRQHAIALVLQSNHEIRAGVGLKILDRPGGLFAESLPAFGILVRGLSCDPLLGPTRRVHVLSTI